MEILALVNVDPRRVRLAPGARTAIARLAAAGWELAIVTNQSGVARGYFGVEDLGRLRIHLEALVGTAGGRLAGMYACPHLPEGDVARYAVACGCRKPMPGLLLEAADELGLDLGRSWFVGDTWMDVAAGRAAAGLRPARGRSRTSPGGSRRPAPRGSAPARA